MSERSNQEIGWIPISKAVARLRRQYEAADIYGSEEICFRAATDTLLRRLRAGQLPGRATGYTWFDGQQDWDAPPSIEDADASGFFAIPPGFWGAFHGCHELSRDADWIAGDFEYKDDSEYIEHYGHVIGLEVWEAQLPSFDHADKSQVSDGPPMIPDVRTAGRPAAKWWPEFAEELAVFLHEEGLPEGSGTEGQSAVIDAIFARLAAAGKAEPGRATVQPVINAVLQRIRSARN